MFYRLRVLPSDAVADDELAHVGTRVEDDEGVVDAADEASSAVGGGESAGVSMNHRARDKSKHAMSWDVRMKEEAYGGMVPSSVATPRKVNEVPDGPPVGKT